MRILPSEQERAEARIVKELDEMKVGRMIRLEEPCDCGDRIQHFNGGNYHEIVRIAKEKDGWYVQFDSTSELQEAGEWTELPSEEIKTLAIQCARDGYYF